jgi:hypothetical protein
MAGRRRSIVALCLLISSFVPTFSATASETVTYSYDARGRLVKVARSGTVNNGVSACYAYDKADNRSNVTVATSSDCANPPPSFAINDVAVTEGGSLVFTVTKTGSTSSSFSVNYASANGTATAGSDYTATSGTLTFAAADATKTVTVATIDDTTAESNETVLVNLSGATGGATISDSQGTGTINDNDSASCGGVSFSVNDRAGDEGTTFTFTVTKAGTTSSSCSISYASANNTAVAPGDYTAVSGTLTFAGNETTKTVSVTVNQNGINAEPTETFHLNLSAATGGATISDSQGVGTIYDVFDENPCPLC